MARRILLVVRRCALVILEMVRFTKAAGSGSKKAPPLFLCSFLLQAYFTYRWIFAPACYTDVTQKRLANSEQTLSHKGRKGRGSSGLRLFRALPHSYYSE